MSELENYLYGEESETDLDLLTKLIPNTGATVYKVDSKGKNRQWTVNVVANGDLSADIVIVTGLVDGQKFTQMIPITEGKNLGKSNSTNPYTQALAEAKARLERQLRSGYVKNVEDVKEGGTLGSGIKAPMLAQKYHPKGLQKGSKTLAKMKLEGKKIHVQPKYDGNRCLITIQREGDNQVSAGMYTRKGDLMPVQLIHIIQPLVDAYVMLTEDNPDAPRWVLDGELFSKEMSFNELNGHLKRKNSQDKEQLAKISYHLYDVMKEVPYDSRYKFIVGITDIVESDKIHLVPSFEIEATDEKIKTKLEDFLKEGHEGLMIRTLDTPYENKRSWSLCKVKLFEDSEYKVLDLEPDAMGRLGHFVMEMDEVGIDKDGKEVKTFKAGCTDISHEEGIKMLANKDQYIGKMATIEYFGKDIRPRFPKFKSIREN